MVLHMFGVILQGVR